MTTSSAYSTGHIKPRASTAATSKHITTGSRLQSKPISSFPPTLRQTGQVVRPVSSVVLLDRLDAWQSERRHTRLQPRGLTIDVDSVTDPEEAHDNVETTSGHVGLDSNEISLVYELLGNTRTEPFVSNLGQQRSDRQQSHSHGSNISTGVVSNNDVPSEKPPGALNFAHAGGGLSAIEMTSDQVSVMEKALQHLVARRCQQRDLSHALEEAQAQLQTLCSESGEGPIEGEVQALQVFPFQ